MIKRNEYITVMVQNEKQRKNERKHKESIFKEI
jgi:hypothetical protein